MDPTKPVPEVVLFFRGAFTIVLALALAEAFKQFVSDKADENEPVVYWQRVPALVSFLLLIIPFYQGMSRYFFVTYADLSKLPQPYSIFLMIDSVAFLGESALFFIMSRALSYRRAFSFYAAVLALLYLDSLWSLIAYVHGASVVAWTALNLVFGGFVAGLLYFLRQPPTTLQLPLIGTGIMLVRTILDYVATWGFYFPTP